MFARLGLALLDRRFRTVLLVVALVPISLSYVVHTLVFPIVSPHGPIDFFVVYLQGAQQLRSGTDPYVPCLTTSCWSYYQNAWWFYPPVVPWLFQPLVGVDPAWSGTIALLAAQLLVAVFVIATMRALAVRDWQVVALFVLVVIAFPPLMSEVVERNVQILLLALSAVWFAGWVEGDAWWAGIALGSGIALKFVQAPLLALTVFFRRARMSAAAVIAVAVLWVAGAPQYLAEYVFRVLPIVNSPGGGPLNVSVAAAVQRLLHPESLFETAYGTGMDPVARTAGYAIAGGVLVLSGLVLRAPRPDREGRALEAAVAIAATPLVVSLVRPGQLLLSLLPMIVLGTIALRHRDRRLGTAVVASWLLMGPVYFWFSNLLSQGIGAQFVRPGAETAALGAVVLWLATVQALRQHDLIRSRDAVRLRTDPDPGGHVGGGALGAGHGLIGGSRSNP